MAIENKKRKPDSGLEEGSSADANNTTYSDPVSGLDEYEDAMPGFHEHDEDDVDMDQAEPEHEEVEEETAMPLLQPRTNDGSSAGPSRTRPPDSAPGRTFSERTGIPGASPSKPYTNNKPHSTGHVSRPSASSSRSLRVPREIPAQDDSVFRVADLVVPETNTCPICGKTLETDNQGFNEHVDFCLSRGAIREAQVQAGSPLKRKTGVALNQDKFQWPKKVGSGTKRKKG